MYAQDQKIDKPNNLKDLTDCEHQTKEPKF